MRTSRCINDHTFGTEESEHTLHHIHMPLAIPCADAENRQTPQHVGIHRPGWVEGSKIVAFRPDSDCRPRYVMEVQPCKLRQSRAVRLESDCIPRSVIEVHSIKQRLVRAVRLDSG